MGKDLKGKELGKGICQRKDGLYFARCQAQGVTHSCYFKTTKEAKSWLKELDKKPKAKRGMTVDQWYQYWMNNLISDLAPNTRRNYAERYQYNVGPYIGDIYLTELKPMHCKQVLNQMEPRYATSSIIQTYITMGTMFKAAMDNDLIDKHPLTGIRVNKPRKAPDDIHFLTIEEQARFFEAAKRSLGIVIRRGARVRFYAGLRS